MTKEERAFNKLTGQRMRVRRKMLGVKQEALALILNRHQSYISRLERGEGGWSLYDYERIQKALDACKTD